MKYYCISQPDMKLTHVFQMQAMIFAFSSKANSRNLHFLLFCTAVIAAIVE